MLDQQNNPFKPNVPNSIGPDSIGPDSYGAATHDRSQVPTAPSPRIHIFVYMSAVSISNEWAIFLGHFPVWMWDAPWHLRTSLFLWLIALCICGFASFLLSLFWDYNRIPLRIALISLTPAAIVFALQQTVPISYELLSFLLFTFLVQTCLCCGFSTEKRWLATLATFMSGLSGAAITVTHFFLYSRIT